VGKGRNRGEEAGEGDVVVVFLDVIAARVGGRSEVEEEGEEEAGGARNN